MPAEDHHGMMGPTCLEHCLDAVHADEAGSGLIASGIEASVQQTLESSSQVSFSWTNTRIESHHDPSRILTTIKRE